MDNPASDSHSSVPLRIAGQEAEMQGTAVPPAWTLVYRYCYGARRVSKLPNLLVLCASCFVQDPPLCPPSPTLHVPKADLGATS